MVNQSMNKYVLFFVAACAALLGVGSGSAAAQKSDYPAKSVRFIIPVPPGGGADLLARTIGQKLTEAWGQTLVIDNRGGAGGTIAVDMAAKAAPDGYTIVMGLIASIAVSVSLIKLPYDPVTDFAPITMLAVAQNILVVHPSLPAVSVKELIALLKSKAGHYHYASAGNGTSPHLSAELFKLMTGVSMNHVPYKGAGPALVDLIAGQVEIYFGSLPATLPQVKAGKLRVLAVTGSRRSQIVPDLPTVAEAGVPGFESNQWYGVLAPAKTPAWIADKLNRDFITVLKLSELRERLFSQGFEVVANSREEFSRYIREEIAKWAKVIKQAGIRAD
ncbi:MAG: tripartite tricarboxylate transporter substrate binding protein [Betaproteobacteria bacterium]|nr:tripartite tricarboxylate transporter substrate binding protein [Betaproteobacteria bacterium]